jgi:hypothetical protein
LISPNNLRLAMKIHKPIQNLKERVMQHVEEEKVIQDLLIRSKETITKQLQNNETLMQFLISNLNRMLSDLKDAATQQKINH